MNFLGINTAITLDFTFKLVVSVVLLLNYFENKDKIFIWWFLGWLFFALQAFCEQLLLGLNYEYLWFLRHLISALSAVFFFSGICLLIKKKRYGVYLVLLAIIAFLSAFVGIYVFNSWFLSALSTSIISGSAFIISGCYYYKKSIDKKSSYHLLITLGFILNGIHNFDYPFLRGVEWFAPFGFIVGVVFSIIFGLGMILKASEESRLQKKVNIERIREITTLYSITSTVCRSRKLDQMLYSVIDNLLRVLKLDMGAIFLIDAGLGNLHLKAQRGLSKKLVEKITKVPVSDAISAECIEKNKMTFLENVSKSGSLIKAALIKDVRNCLVSVPLRSGNKVLGAFELGLKKARRFSSQDVRLLESAGDELGVAIDNKQLSENLESVYLSTVLTLTDMVEAKDHYTRSHSDEVARYAVMTAKELKLPDKKIEQVRMASQLHDLGKIAISDLILLKKGKLTKRELKEIKKHPEKAVEILKPLRFLHDDNGVLEYIKSHHERYDGKGYPNGYKKQQIKLGARILAVADSYHAMISSRPYRKRALTVKQAKLELKRNAGLQFDPEVVETFLNVLAEIERSKDKY